MLTENCTVSSSIRINGAIDKLAPPTFHTGEHKTEEYAEPGANSKAHKRPARQEGTITSNDPASFSAQLDQSGRQGWFETRAGGDPFCSKLWT